MIKRPKNESQSNRSGRNKQRLEFLKLSVTGAFKVLLSPRPGYFETFRICFYNKFFFQETIEILFYRLRNKY